MEIIQDDLLFLIFENCRDVDKIRFSASCKKMKEERRVGKSVQDV